MAKISVIISTYNKPDWLEKTLWGYEFQTFKDFELLVADDGSDEITKNLIEKIKKEVSYRIIHVWHEDMGFRKCDILNKAIIESNTDYLFFSDGDCIPRNDLLEKHIKHREKGRFLSGGYHKLPMDISESIDKDIIESQKCFDKDYLLSLGMKRSFRNNKLTSHGFKEKFLNFITTTKPSWNGHNSSGWKEDMLAVNGYDERMKYGGQDREFGERLENYGIKGKQIRYSAICVHLDHKRSYIDNEKWEFNRSLRKKVRRNGIKYTEFGIKK